MKRVVALVRNYKPYNSAVGICVGNVLECMRGHADLWVVCEKSRPEEEAYEVVDGEHVLRFLSPQTRRRAGLAEKAKRAKSALTRGLWRVAYEGVRAAYNIQFLSSRQSVQKKLVDCYLDALRSLPFVPDLLVPTCMPVEALIACRRFCEENPGTVYVPLLFDRFADSGTLHRLAFNKRLKYRRNQQIEQEVLGDDACARVLYVESWQGRIASMEGIAPASLIEHPLLVKRGLERAPVFDGGVVNLVYAGTLTWAARNPSCTLEIARLLSCQDLPIVLHVYGAGDAMRAVAECAGRYPHAVKHHGSVTAEEASRAIGAADVLVSIGNSDTAQTPSKVFEYMATGKPILHIAKTADDPVIEVLSRYPLAVTAVEDTALSSAEIERIRYYIREYKGKAVPFEEVARLFETALPSYAAGLLRDCLDASGVAASSVERR